MSQTLAQKFAFALRTTLAALLAALVAFEVNLPQASTSMATVFIVSQPLAGMVLSKSLFRVIGTATGAAIAVALTAAFSETPELFAFAISLWIGLCVAVSVFMRDAPAAYGALLSGYTVAIVAFPTVGTPDTIFQAAMDRGAEIFVGILSATILSQAFFPQSAGQALRRTIRSAVASASSWGAETLHGRSDASQMARDRRRLVSDVLRIESLRIHAAFDDVAVRLSGRRMRRLHGRLVGFLALLVSLQDRMETMRAEQPQCASRLRPVLARAAEVMSPEASADQRAAAKAALLAAAPDVEAMRADRARVAERALLLRAADLVEVRGEIAALSAAAAGSTEDDPAGDVALARYRDVGFSLVAGAAAFVSMLTICAFWIASGWTAGAGAAVMVAVMTSLFAQQDDPSRTVGVFLVMTAIGAVVAGVYVFLLLPRLEGFAELALALAPLLFAAAWAMTSPALALPGLGGALGSINLLGLTNVMAPDFANFANSTLAQIGGIGLAVVLLRALRPIGAAWPVSRVLAGLAAELLEAASGRERVRAAFESRMFDRIDALMTRLDLEDPDSVAIERGALAALRTGGNAMALRRVLPELPAEVAAPIEAALAALARHFDRLSRGEASAPPLDLLDAALDAALGADLRGREDAADPLVWISSIRTSLAQHPRLFGEPRAPSPETAPMAAAS